MIEGSLENFDYIQSKHIKIIGIHRLLAYDPKWWTDPTPNGCTIGMTKTVSSQLSICFPNLKECQFAQPDDCFMWTSPHKRQMEQRLSYLQAVFRSWSTLASARAWIAEKVNFFKCNVQIRTAGAGRQTWEGVGEWEGHSLIAVFFANHSSNLWGFFCFVSILEWCCYKMWSGAATEGAGQSWVRQFGTTGPCCPRHAFRIIFFRRAC